MYMTFADQVLSFYKNLEIKAPLPKGVVVLNPYLDNESFSYCTKFYKKFFDDSDERTLILRDKPGASWRRNNWDSVYRSH